MHYRTLRQPDYARSKYEWFTVDEASITHLLALHLMFKGFQIPQHRADRHGAGATPHPCSSSICSHMHALEDHRGLSAACSMATDS
jgi:hypothetical protein